MTVDPLNRKAYINRWERDETRDITYWFCEFAKDAAFWESEFAARHARDILNVGVRIPSIQGGIHSLRNFEIEEVNPGRFVISCSGPFIYRETGVAA